MRSLTAKQRAFAHAVARLGGNATAAYREVYKCSQGVAESNACVLMGNAGVAKIVAELQGKQLAKLDASAESIKLELARVAKVDVAKAFDERGKLLPLHKMPEDVRRAISSVERDAKGRVKVRFWSKNEALGLLAKHHGLLREILEVRDVVETRDITDDEWEKLSLLEHRVRGDA